MFGGFGDGGCNIGVVKVLIVILMVLANQLLVISGHGDGGHDIRGGESVDSGGIGASGSCDGGQNIGGTVDSNESCCVGGFYDSGALVISSG